jgi:hypothetical protein
MNQPNDTPEPSLASAGSLPEAWAVEWKGDTKIDRSTVCYTEDAAKRKADECPGLDGVAVPLYRAPTLTDKEREALRKVLRRVREDYFAGRFADSVEVAAVIDGLLERTK